MPEFQLSSSYTLKVGRNIAQNYSFVPFSQCQNAQFFIVAIDSQLSEIPNWLTIDQLNQAVTINYLNITSIGLSSIIFNARLITLPYPYYLIYRYTTTNYTTTFNFANNNWIYSSSNSSYYIVVNQISIFELMFKDEEGDKIILTVLQNDFINTFVKYYSNNTSMIDIMLQANTAMGDSTQLILFYYDSYHQTQDFIMNITYEIYIFKTDPPYFVTDPPDVNTNRWKDSTVALPESIDPNGLRYKINMDSSTPSWVILNQNNTLTLKLSDLTQSVADQTVVSLTLLNEENAWRKYNFTIRVDQYISSNFQPISNITIKSSGMIQAYLGIQSNFSISAVFWYNSTTIPWIHYNQSTSTLIIDYSSVFFSVQWVRLKSTDSWARDVYSNPFYVIADPNSGKSTLMGTDLGPIVLFVGYEKIIKIPSDLFISSRNLHLDYDSNVVSWLYDLLLQWKIGLDSKKDSYLYLKSNYVNTCDISITATDSQNNTAEILAKVSIVNCASKDWSRCVGIYQSDWTQWKTNFVLDFSGVWYWNTTYLPSSVNDIFDIWGIIVLSFLIIQLIFSFRLGLRSLSVFEFAQIIIIFIYSPYQSNQNVQRLASWFLFSKFDFGVISYSIVSKVFNWNVEYERMAKIQYFWQSAFLNYFSIISFALIFLSLFVILKYLMRKIDWLTYVYNFICIIAWKQNIIWIVIHLQFRFILTNMIYDALSMRNHMTLSLVSFLILLIAVVSLLIKDSSIFTWKFLKEVDRTMPAKVATLSLIICVFDSLWFTIEILWLNILIMIWILTYHIFIAFFCLLVKIDKSLYISYTMKMNGIKHNIFSLILLIIMYSLAIPNSDTLSRTIVLTVTAFFSVWMLIDMIALPLVKL